ncbi:hypothetical protein [Kallotenue papyrolyticum]|uniref:hypothetical protein n=1 Tax=Kallotenue papyrolyticum TaxID=1325125 RepID=UPI001377A122|nr:hypothetical protein [Kallotenue papyrolyticum]
MSPTFLEITVAVLAAVLIFLWALRVVPPLLEALADYLRRNVAHNHQHHQEQHNHDHEQ